MQEPVLDTRWGPRRDAHGLCACGRQEPASMVRGGWRAGLILGAVELRGWGEVGAQRACMAC